MASGKTHDKAGLYSSVALSAIAILSGTSRGMAIAFAMGNFLGYLYLSPDLDIKSKPFYRWGMLRYIWIPLQRATKHRGLTHVPILGALAMQAYLGLFVVPLWFVALGLGAFSYLAFVAGHVCQQLVHLCLDYWPKK